MRTPSDPDRRRRVLVTGGAGTVARRLVLATPAGVDLHLTARRSQPPPEVAARGTVHRIDLARPGPVDRLLRDVAPDVGVHTAYTTGSRADVVDATAAVAAAAAVTGAAMVHLSTDVVFAGDSPPYGEGDPLDPVSDYGRLKAEAERVAVTAVPDACITRTSLVVSTDPPDRATAGLAQAVRQGRTVTLFRDELRQPIRADDLAAELWALLALPRTERAGVWHLPGPEHLSRLELGLRLVDALGLDRAPVRPGSVADHPTPRPRDTRLLAGRRRALGVALRPVDR